MSRDYSRRLPAGTKVSAGTPIGRNVTAHFPLVRDFKSAVRGRPGLGVSNGPYIRPDPTGKAAMGVGSGKISTGLLASDLGMDGAKARTIIVEFMQMDVSGGRAVYSFGTVSTQHRSQFSLLSASNFRRVKLETYANDYEYILWDQGGTYARVFLAITYDGGTTIRVRSHCRVFLNNGAPQGVVSRSFTTTTGGILATGDTVPLDLMGGGVYSFASMNSQLFNATFIGGRALTEREIDNFYRNPQQIKAAAPSFNYAALASAPALNEHTLAAAWTEQNETQVAIAQAAVSAGVAQSEQGEAHLVAGAVAVRAALAQAEQGDAHQVATSVQASAAITQAEQGDTHQVGAAVQTNAAIAQTEQGDTHAAFGVLAVRATAAWVESNDVQQAVIAVGSGAVLSAAWVEKSEAQAVAGQIRVNAAASWTEQPEGFSLGGLVRASATAGWIEKSEAHAIIGVVAIPAGAEDIDPYSVPLSRWAVFEGSKRAVVFEGSRRVVVFEGSRRVVRFEGSDNEAGF